MRIARAWILVAALGVVLSACDDDEATTPEAPIEMTTSFNLNVDGQPLLPSISYTNESGTSYTITSLRFVISDVTLHNENGGSVKVADLHYYDWADVTTHTFKYTGLPHEEWSSVTFTFGLDETDNVRDKYSALTQFHFAMFWPPTLGPNLGYHYMQLTGSYKTSPTTAAAYGTHTGPRQLDGNNIDFPGVVDATPHHFHFAVDLPFTPTHIHNEGQGQLTINFNLNDWYKDNDAADGMDTTYDFDDYQIVMGNLDAQGKLKANGRYCFSATLESHGGHH